MDRAQEMAVDGEENRKRTSVVRLLVVVVTAIVIVAAAGTHERNVETVQVKIAQAGGKNIMYMSKCEQNLRRQWQSVGKNSDERAKLSEWMKRYPGTFEGAWIHGKNRRGEKYEFAFEDFNGFERMENGKENFVVDTKNDGMMTLTWRDATSAKVESSECRVKDIYLPVTVASLLSGSSAAWVDGTGLECDAACSSHSLTAVSSGTYGNPSTYFYVCRAGLDGWRSGWQLTQYKFCAVTNDGLVESKTTYQCLCGGAGVFSWSSTGTTKCDEACASGLPISSGLMTSTGKPYHVCRVAIGPASHGVRGGFNLLDGRFATICDSAYSNDNKPYTTDMSQFSCLCTSYSSSQHLPTRRPSGSPSLSPSGSPSGSPSRSPI